MDLLKIIQSLEELLYEIALWAILLPKTFFKVIFHPGWAQTYIATEWEKDASDRYEYYMSPILFWVIVAVIPYLLTLNYSASHDNPNDTGIISAERIFLAIASTLLSGPLGVAVSIQKTRGLPIGRKSLKRIFYTQCLCFGPASLLFLPTMIIEQAIMSSMEANEAYEPSDNLISLFILAILIPLGWLYFAEINVIRLESGVNSRKAFRILINGLALVFLLALVLSTASVSGVILLR